MLRRTLLLILFALAYQPHFSPGQTAPAQQPPSLAAALAKLKEPADWFATTTVSWDPAKPWKDGRLEIRRLLGLNTEAGRRQAIKLTWLYRERQDIGDGHEWPLYLYLGGELAWAVKAHREFLASPRPHPPVGAALALASLYTYFGEWRQAEAVLDQAEKLLAQVEDKWRIARQADLADARGDVAAAQGQTAQAKAFYGEAVKLYPTSKQPWNRHQLHMFASRVQAKIDLLDLRALRPGQLKDGQYQAQALGYAKEIKATVTVKGGRMTDIALVHEEKIEQNAAVLIPQRIIAQQTPDVEGITGATVTCSAIEEAVLKALRQGGL